jgi:16S rRNA (guanine966-N2)-methyltransferase
MRVVAGRLKGRSIEAPATSALRPTADRARQAVFNLLRHARAGDAVTGTHVLDAFAGTGAMGIEALSQGAARAVFLDLSRDAVALVQRNLESLGLAAIARVVRADALTPPGPPAHFRANLVFVDAPYRSGLGGRALAALDRAGWIAPGATVAIETEAGESETPPAGFQELDRRRYGRAEILLLRRDLG